MAQQPQQPGDQHWNPASWPEDQHSSNTSIPDGGLADLLAAASPQESHPQNLKSSLSDEDFSAWDMPHETIALDTGDLNVDVPTVDAPPTQNTTNPDVVAANHSAEQNPKEPLQNDEIAQNGWEPAQELSNTAQPDVDLPPVAPVEQMFASHEPATDITSLPAGDTEAAPPEDLSSTAESPIQDNDMELNIEEAGQQAYQAVSHVDAAVAQPTQPENDTGHALATKEDQPASDGTKSADDKTIHVNYTEPASEKQLSAMDIVEHPPQLVFPHSNSEDISVDPFTTIARTHTDQARSSSDMDHQEGHKEPNVEASVQLVGIEQTGAEVPSIEMNTNGASAWGDQMQDDVDSDGDDFFNQLKTQTKPIFGPPETESRFEEGVPLLEESDTTTVREVQQETASGHPFVNDDDDDDAEDFFNSVQKSEVSTDPPIHLTRKSTSQVMGSVGFDIASPTSDISVAAQLEDVLKAANSGASEGPESQVPAEDTVPSEDDIAARWEAELSDTMEDDLAARWEAALDLDDDDMLLEDELINPAQSQPATQRYVPQSPIAPTDRDVPSGLHSPFETPQSQTAPRPVPGMYIPHQPTTADLIGGIPIPGVPPAASATGPPYFSQQPINPVANRGESFAERSKEGYKSPYDLPDDLSRPRRPMATHRPVPPAVTSMPPPPVPNSGMPPQGGVSVAPPVAASVPPPAPKNFYEELPLSPPKPRPTSSGRYSPNPSVAAPTAGPSLAAAPKNPYAAAVPVAGATEPTPVQSLLHPPERLDPYAAPSSLASSAPAGPSAASRYSPKPPGLQAPGKPPTQPRYSPAPPGAGPSVVRNRYASQPLTVPGQANSLPFQPRTSSPLAYHEKVSYQPEEAQRSQPPSLQPSVDLSPPRAQRPSIDQGSPYAPHPATLPATLDGASASTAQQQMPQPPKNRYAPPEYVNEFTNRIAPNNDQAAPVPTAAVPISSQAIEQQPAPLRRSQTSSPGQQMVSPRASVPPISTLPRPASVHGQGSPTKTTNPYAPGQPSVQSRARALSQHLNFIAPIDGQEHDPLERWKGAPIFKFGFGGAVVSCFPHHIPRYAVGQAAPLIKPSPGEPKFSQLSQWLPPVDTIVQHPGPLKNKAKKKDVMAWLSSKIAAFENELPPGFDQYHPDAQKRHEEKILLWKVTRILVENDGVLEGSDATQAALRQVFFPQASEPESDGAVSNLYGTSTGFMPLNITAQADGSDAGWMEELRSSLVQGDREKAVWGAVDRRLWGHAMVLASTMDKSVWKQVVQEFVRREIRSTSANTESLAALYEIFGGNAEECVDELVPPSARAGHQLISKSDGHGATKNALQGLDSWKDTLGLVLNNRSSEDHQALLALGRLLASYGRVEAAHICFIFSRGAIFGGADDPQANIVLLGADHQRFPCSLMDEDSILLTEIYEFATSVLGNSPVATLPYLLAFKLLYAKMLADHGRKTEAQYYCDSVAAALKASTRPSPYHHQHLFVEVDELSARLRQTTSDGGSSWISKPSMEKVSGSMWARFNSFVAGDDSDAASTGSGKAGETADFGPFANVAGTPTISRSPSVSDLYGSYPGAGAQPIPAQTGGSSRYLPNQHALNASPEQFRGRSSMDSQRSASISSMPFGQRRSSQEHASPLVDNHAFQGGATVYGSPGTIGYQPTPPQSSYMPLAPVEEDLTTQSPAEGAPGSQPALNGLFYQPPAQESAVAGSPYYQGPPGMPQSENPPSYMPPPAAQAYEPPSYAHNMSIAPEQTEEPSAMEEEPQPKKKSFMDDDDDDDLAARAAAIQKSQKSENDRKADEAFRKAAEEDAKRDAQQSTKKGWFGGWFGGAKKEAENTGGGPIRAKLGEKNSFYYDQDLKKWVNKKDPNSATPARATPPPPRGSTLPSRAASSGSLPPPSGPPMSSAGSRPPSSSSDMPPPLSSSPAFSGIGVPPPMPRSVSTGAAVPTPPGSSSGLPPRPPSSLTHASSIDDLLGAPAARKGNTVKGKKKGRYVDVMAK
ncbi:hypothetical protein N7462_010416 [Penicillium macrosclerotiorum]|uniref:uncharacterized protein n=1 Tax=Penicillium macrosclerotiorum TaxID=303699 RepID=UPI0025472559|nr:uncharacterized protein N7462_010416 [Penicillium macrosclerotiorum]KAJ5669346.1 hypothetical protein N7462_010416 [Penicillium macrosclerotiorum]